MNMYSQERQIKDVNEDCSSTNGYKENKEDKDGYTAPLPYDKHNICNYSTVVILSLHHAYLMMSYIHLVNIRIKVCVVLIVWASFIGTCYCNC